MVTPLGTRPWRSPHLATLVASWWLVSVAFSLLSLQPFEAFLAAQAPTATLPAYDPFVLFVGLLHDQRALPSAVGASGAWMFFGVLASQLPLTLILVSLLKRASSRVGLIVSTATALPYITAFSLLGHGIPLFFVTVLQTLVSRPSVLNASPTTLYVWAMTGAALLVVWLVCSTCLDVARICVVAQRQSGSPLRVLWCSMCFAVRTVMHTPIHLLAASALTRALGLLSIGAALTYSVTLANGNPPATWWVPWLVTQAAVLLGLGLRVAWFTYATRRVHNLRPPSRSS